MNFDDLKQHWQQQVNTPAATESLAQAAKAVQFESGIRMRDHVETAAAVFVVLFMGPLLFQLPIGLAWTGVLIIVLGMFEIVAVLHWTRRRDAANPADLSLADYLRCERIRVERQMRLLRQVGLWYLAPCLGGAGLFILGSAESIWISLPVCAVFAILGYGIYRMNQAAIARELIPLRDSLLQAETELAADAVPDDDAMKSAQ